MRTAPRPYSDLSVRQDLAVRMRDGVELATDLYLPNAEQTYPTLLQRTAYFKDASGTANSCLDVLQAVHRGYAVVVQDCRGRGKSDGHFEPFSLEGPDGADAVRWIVGQPWSDGNVAMFGRSYSGAIQWLAAAQAGPALKTIVPMVSGPNVAEDWFDESGDFEFGFAVMWALTVLAPDLLRRLTEDGRRIPLRSSELVELIDHIDDVYWDPSGQLAAPLKPLLPWLYRWIEPGERAASMATLRALCPDPQSIRIPVLMVAGWYDIFVRGCLRAFAALRGTAHGEVHRLIVGPWAHGRLNTGVFPEREFGLLSSYQAIDVNGMQLDWFDRWLKPEQVDPDPGPAVTIFTIGTNSWRDQSSWPPTDTTQMTLRLSSTVMRLGGADAHALTENEDPEERALRIDYDQSDPAPTIGGPTFLPGLDVGTNTGPRNQISLLSRNDAILFANRPQSAAMEITGEIMATLELRGAPNGLLIVGKLVDVSEDALRIEIVTEGARRIGGGSNVTATQIDLGVTSYVVPKGHRVGVIFSTNSYPRYDRVGAEVTNGHVEILVGAGRRSELILPIAGRVE